MLAFRKVTLDALRVTGARELRDDAYYPKLAELLRRDGYSFRIGPKTSAGRALLLNLSFWNPDDNADVLVGSSLPADVVAHVAWHHAARKSLGDTGATVDGMLLGESVASAFDLYLIGHLLRDAPDAEMLQSQVPALSDVAADAGLSARAFTKLLEELADDPARAFAELRQLLFDVATQLVRCQGIDAAAAALHQFAGHRFYALLHHYNVSNWVLHSRAYGGRVPARVERLVARIDAELRGCGSELTWLSDQWLSP